MFVRTRFQYGSLRLRKRERGSDVWEFRYYETNPKGKRIRQSVTVLNGWMSGIAFMPPWVAPVAGKCNIFSDPNIIDAEKLLFGKIAKAIGTHPRFLGFDLGNELGVLMGSNPATPAQADAWADEMLMLCDQVAPGKFHVNGVDHEHWFADFGFTRENLATAGKATVVHSYAYFTGALRRYGYSGVGTLHLVEYMIEFAYTYQMNPARRVWVEEVGVSPSWVPANYLLDYADQVVRNAADTGKAWGITWWCSHDMNPAIRWPDLSQMVTPSATGPWAIHVVSEAPTANSRYY